MLVIPTYNEVENVEGLIKEIKKAAPDLAVTFVDDNSPDGTGERLEKLKAKHPKISVIHRRKKAGLGSAYREAFLKLINNPQAEYLIEMDADFSHPADTLPEIIRGLENYDMVIGSRYVRGGEIKNWNLMRRLISYAGCSYAKIITGVKIKDMTSGYVGYRAGLLKKIGLERINSEGYGFQIEMKCRAVKTGAKYTEIPIIFTERKEGKSKFSLAILLEAIFVPWRLRE